MRVERICELFSVYDDAGDFIGNRKRYAEGVWFDGILPEKDKKFRDILEVERNKLMSRESEGR